MFSYPDRRYGNHMEVCVMDYRACEATYGPGDMDQRKYSFKAVQAHWIDPIALARVSIDDRRLRCDTLDPPDNRPFRSSLAASFCVRRLYFGKRRVILSLILHLPSVSQALAGGLGTSDTKFISHRDDFRRISGSYYPQGNGELTRNTLRASSRTPSALQDTRTDYKSSCCCRDGSGRSMSNGAFVGESDSSSMGVPSASNGHPIEGGMRLATANSGGESW
ncbi:hypothetical protein OE88DRAFT_1648832 [Heliocybe sulcata]|uniref:Uncharacterized protein n=1 Tax=Heliocybe sulcata TaxID=5364 RepID=A0A5C3ML20_9AGAM|nr:hypothetical protein OE88DRAFT_1648832 [Heliocybe sulcata]